MTNLSYGSKIEVSVNQTKIPKCYSSLTYFNQSDELNSSEDGSYRRLKKLCSEIFPL